MSQPQIYYLIRYVKHISKLYWVKKKNKILFTSMWKTKTETIELALKEGKTTAHYYTF